MATANDSIRAPALAPFYGSESVHANAIQPLAPLATKQSIYVAGYLTLLLRTSLTVHGPMHKLHTKMMAI